MTDSFALREALAYEIKRWRPAKTFGEALIDADTVIAALAVPTTGTFPIMHEPLVKWVADNFVVHWKEASAALSGLIQIVMPALSMFAGENNSGARTGFRWGSYGDVVPDELADGNLIEEIRYRVSNGNFTFRVDGHYPQDAFYSMEIVGQAPVLLTASANNFDNSGTYTEWKWNASGFSILTGETYAIDFT